MKATRSGVLLLLLAVAIPSLGADDEAQVRALDDAERKAILERDVPTLERLMAEHLIVNNPEHRVVVGRAAVIERIRDGRIDYRSFERNIELVRIDGDIAFVMGEETVVPRDSAAPTLLRRFTNIWRRHDGSWLLTARQATIVRGE